MHFTYKTLLLREPVATLNAKERLWRNNVKKAKSLMSDMEVRFYTDLDCKRELLKLNDVEKGLGTALFSKFANDTRGAVKVRVVH